MSNSNSGFVVVSGGNSTTWTPNQVFDKEGNKVGEAQASENSWIEGFYVGTKEGVGANNSKVHTLKHCKVGDTKNLKGEFAESASISVWGTFVLDATIEENISPGEYIKIQWEGKKASKTVGKTYNSFIVMKDPSKVIGDEMGETSEEIAKHAAVHAGASEDGLLEDDEDPFK